MNGIDICDERFRAMVLPNAPLETLGEGYRWLEGPVWFADHDCLYVSDIPNDRILRWSEDGGISVFRKPSGFANGHARDRQGRLIGCSHREPLHHAHRARRHRDRARQPLSGQATQLTQRYRLQVATARFGSATRPTASTPITRAASSKRSCRQPSIASIPPRGDLAIAADDFDGTQRPRLLAR